VPHVFIINEVSSGFHQSSGIRIFSEEHDRFGFTSEAVLTSWEGPRTKVAFATAARIGDIVIKGGELFQQLWHLDHALRDEDEQETKPEEADHGKFVPGQHVTNPAKDHEEEGSDGGRPRGAIFGCGLVWSVHFDQHISSHDIMMSHPCT
jgi:hypothetical protein